MSIFVPVRNDFSHPERESRIKIKRHIGRHILGDKMSEMCQRFQLEKEFLAAFVCFNSQVTVCLGGIRSMSKEWSVRCPTSKFRQDLIVRLTQDLIVSLPRMEIRKKEKEHYKIKKRSKLQNWSRQWPYGPASTKEKKDLVYCG